MQKERILVVSVAPSHKTGAKTAASRLTLSVA